MTPFQQSLARVSAAIGVRMVFGSKVLLPSGRTVLPQAHVLDFGAPEGTLIFHAHDEYRDFKDELSAAGYSYSEFGTPTETNFDPESLKETLAEWGWTGAAANEPSWVVLFQHDPPGED